MESDAVASWDALTADLVERIATFAPPNEVACSLRLLNKSASKILQHWKLARLSEPVPHHAFVHRWGGESSMDGLMLKQRKQLLCLLACSGCIANLAAAVSVAGCPLTHELFKAAAKGGHVEVCIWLRERGCAHNYRAVMLSAAAEGHTAVVRWVMAQAPDPGALVRLAEIGMVEAAGAGHRALCEELLAAGARGVTASLAAPSAAKGGHVELTEWLLEQGPRYQNTDVNDPSLLLEAAYGFPLPVLQRLYHTRLTSSSSCAGYGCLTGREEFAEAAGSRGTAAAAAAAVAAGGGREDFAAHWGERVALQAVRSPTPDWRTKLEWLEAVGCRLRGHDGALGGWSGVFDCGDALDRAEFLLRRGLVGSRELARAAVARGSLGVVRHLRAEGLLLPPVHADADAKGSGAAEDLLLQSEEQQQLQQQRGGGGGDLTAEAAAGGSVELLAELLVARWPVGPDAVQRAAANGHLHVLRWMLEAPEAAPPAESKEASPETSMRLQGPAAAASAAAAVRHAVAGKGRVELLRCAAGSGSVELVEWLRERGCEWDERAFTAAVGAGSVALLEWLVARGCPMPGAPGQAYVAAGRNGDFATLRCLRRLGCPWGDTDGRTFLAALGGQGGFAPCSLEVLRWLVEQGCPVDWRAARRVVEGRRDSWAAGVLPWIDAQLAAKEAQAAEAGEGGV